MNQCYIFYSIYIKKWERKTTNKCKSRNENKVKILSTVIVYSIVDSSVTIIVMPNSIQRDDCKTRKAKRNTL